MFQDRKEAGKLLARKLSEYKASRDSIVLAIPRGGVVVGKQISIELSLPLSLVVVKKLGAPNNPELAIGAVAQNDTRYINWDLSLRSGVEQEYLDKEIKDKSEEITERLRKFQIFRKSGIHDAVNAHSSQTASGQIPKYKNYILVDDGVATGATVMVAIRYIKRQITNNKEQKIILAVPVIAKETYNRIQSEVDKIIAMEIPQSFNAVGQFYKDFPQVSDEEVIRILKS